MCSEKRRTLAQKRLLFLKILQFMWPLESIPSSRREPAGARLTHSGASAKRSAPIPIVAPDAKYAVARV